MQESIEAVDGIGVSNFQRLLCAVNAHFRAKKVEMLCFLDWTWITRLLLELLVVKQGLTLTDQTFFYKPFALNPWCCCSLRVILCVNMISSAHESLKHSQSHSFSLSPLNTHNLGNAFQLSHCQNNVIVSANIIRTEFIQTWAESEAVLHCSFFLIIKGFCMPFPFTSAHGCQALWQCLIENGSLYISEQVHIQHWS